MNNTIKKVLMTGSMLVVIGVLGFGTAYGYGGGSRSGSSSNFSAPIVVAPVVTNANVAPAGKVLGASSYTFTSRLSVKSRGEAVNQLQTILNSLGYNSGPVDGAFGPLTKAALIKFQVANGLVGDGIVGPLTRAALNK